MSPSQSTSRFAPDLVIPPMVAAPVITLEVASALRLLDRLLAEKGS